MHQTDLDLLDIGGQQRQRRQRGRADSEPLARSGGRVPQRIERIGAAAHLGSQLAHLGVSARIVGDRAVGVGGQRDAQRREHPHGGDADAVKPQRHIVGRHQVRHIETDGTQIGHNNRHADGDDRHGRRDHTYADTRNDDRRRTGLSALGNFLRRFIGVRRIVFGRLTDDDAGHESRDDRERKSQPVLNIEQVENDEGRGGDQHRADIDPHAQRPQQLTHRGALFGPHEEDSDDR